jgi:hypothetical protein
MIDEFIAAIHSKTKIELFFYSKEDHSLIQRTCAPMDYGPSRRAKNKDDRFHLWDYDSDEQNHVLSLLPNQILKMEFLTESFSPSEFITWNTKASPWFVTRDWGTHS